MFGNGVFFMKSKVHIIIAADGRSPHTLAISRKKLSVVSVLTAVAAVVAVAATFFSAYTLVQLPERKQQLEQMAAKVEMLKRENSNLLVQVDRQQREKQQLMSDAVSDLNERTAQLESILTKVGVTVPSASDDNAARATAIVDSPESFSSSGGPFIAVVDVEDGASSGEVQAVEVLDHSDKLLDLIAKVPLGRPSVGYCSSAFGRRIDPINGKRAFHSGIDIASNVGTKVYATADGTVVSCGTVNGYGKMVKLRNGERFSTVFGHLQKILVRRGENGSLAEMLLALWAIPVVPPDHISIMKYVIAVAQLIRMGLLSCNQRMLFNGRRRGHVFIG